MLKYLISRGHVYMKWCPLKRVIGTPAVYPPLVEFFFYQYPL